MQQEQGFIGCKLRYLPLSHLVDYSQQLLLMQHKRKITTLNLQRQSMTNATLQERPMHCAHHPQLDIFLLLNEHQLAVVNSEGELINKLPLEGLSGAKFFYLAGLEDGNTGPNDRQDFLVYVKGDNLFGVNMNIWYERQMIKHRGICDFKFSTQNNRIYQSPQYVEGQKFLKNEKIIILWSHKETFVYKLPNFKGQDLEILYIYNKISRRQNVSNDYAISLPLKIMAVAFNSGVVKLFNFDNSKKYILELKGHAGPCIAIRVAEKTPSILYSVGVDCSLRVWQLIYFQALYVLRIDTVVADAAFVGQGLLFGSTKEGHGKSWLLEINSNLLEPATIDSGEIVRQRCDETWCIAIYSNNLVTFFPTVNTDKGSLSSQKFEYPEKYGNVRDVVRLGPEQYSIILQHGFSVVRFSKRNVEAENFQLKKMVYEQSIVRAKVDDDQFIELIHEKLLGTYLFNVIKDWKGIPFALSITSISFFSSDWLPKWEGTSQERVAREPRASHYCVLGTNKGEILLVNLENRVKYYTRVHLHSTSVTMARKLNKNGGNGQLYFCSMSRDGQFIVWCLSHTAPPAELLGVTNRRQFTFFEVYSNFLVMGEKTGQLTIAELCIEGRQVKMKKSNNISGHLKPILFVDYMHQDGNHLFLSCGEDRAIKIWRGLEKQLIFELKLFGSISAVSFIRHGLTILVCHDQQLSFIKASKLASLKKAEDQLKDAYSTYEVQYFGIRHFFSKTVELEEPASPTRRPAALKQEGINDFALMFRQTQRQRGLRLFKEESSTTPHSPQINRATSLQNHMKKNKRFHVPPKGRQSELMLPRIKMKSVHNKTSFLTHHEQQLLVGIQKLRDKSFSKAGRQL